MEFLRDTVTDKIRPFVDSDLEVTRVWYPVPWGTPMLGFPTAFTCARWEPFPWLERTVGEVYPPQVSFVKTPTPERLTFQKVCGTPEEFAAGVVFDPDTDAQRDAEGIPACCDRPPPPPPPPPCIPAPAPAVLCPNAPLVQVGQCYTWTENFTTQTEGDYWRFDGITAGTYRLDVTGDFPYSPASVLFDGTACFTATQFVPIESSPVSITVAAGQGIWLFAAVWDTQGLKTYTFTLTKTG